MSWTGPRDVRAQLQKLWDRGELLSGLINGVQSFPRRLVLKVPGSNEMASRFDEVRTWIAELRGIPHCRIEMREFTHRVLGVNSVPQAIWIDSLEDALALIGKQRETKKFIVLAALLRQRQPALLEWLAKRPLRALELADDWERLIDVVDWMQSHPRPGIYLRQVDIPGVHSKFIESYRGVLSEWFDIALAPEAIDWTKSGLSQFSARYGFREKPIRIRFRILNDRQTLLPGGGRQDITLDAESFAGLTAPAGRVFITENETNFLAFPQAENSIIIFGGGYGWEMLGNARWLMRCTIRYWGDIDTHGFAILNQLRTRFDHVESFLMDRRTLMAHESVWGHEPDQSLHDLPMLNAEERMLFDDLRDNRIRKNLRLEQEMIGFRWVEDALRIIGG